MSKSHDHIWPPSSRPASLSKPRITGRQLPDRSGWPAAARGSAIALLAGIVWLTGCFRQPPALPATPGATNTPAAPPRVVFPTSQQNLLAGADPAVFQPTLSGKAESALYGSVRSEKNGRRLLAAFHEGLDIAALQRDARGRPRDAVFAVMDGTVAYVNRIAGNSNYGRYIVLIHPTAVGDLYTLYAHLAEPAPGLSVGQDVTTGRELGVMGNTSSSPIPLALAHLHFEVGLIANARFERWFKAQRLKPNHGNFNGWNLLGLDPLAFFAGQQRVPPQSIRDLIGAIAPAFEIIIKVSRPLDYFQRYPALWEGGLLEGSALWLQSSESGLPLRGRPATASERQALRARAYRVGNVNPAALGRNGCRLVVCRKGEWQLGAEGVKWLKILTY